MKNVGYRNAWAFLDGYRGKEFQGKWPGVNEMFHISVLRFPDHLRVIGALELVEIDGAL